MKAGYVLFGLIAAACCGMAAAGEPTDGVKAKNAAGDTSPIQEIVAAARLPDPVPLLPHKVAPPPLLEAPPSISPPAPQLSNPEPPPAEAPVKTVSGAARELGAHQELQSATTP